MNHLKVVVLCGGSGTRLWPLSRRSLPKQFVSLIDGKSLLQKTFERVVELCGDDPIWTVASEEHRFLVRDAAESASISFLSILEPVGRNTAAAMATAALNSEKDQLLLFLPADHHVPDTNLFIQTIKKGIDSANQGAFVTFGIVPSSPNTGYGYIQISESTNVAKPVVKFVEKPDYQKAVAYIDSGVYYWNAGIFLVRADILIEVMKKYSPDILLAAKKAVEKQEIDGDFIHLDEESFSACRSDSIDYAVLEKHDNVSMIPFLGVWSDVGSWNAVSELIPSDINNNRIVGNGKVHNSSSTYIHAHNRPVISLGTNNLLIIDTPDALLVAEKECAEEVKDVVSELIHEQLPQATEHRYSSRPWGEYDTIGEGYHYKVKRIKVKPGASLSLQTHQHRAEHWIVVKGIAYVTCGEEKFYLYENQSTYIPIRTKHRLSNPGDFPLEIIEVQSGSYLAEDDIQRFDDDYGRAAKKHNE